MCLGSNIVPSLCVTAPQGLIRPHLRRSRQASAGLLGSPRYLPGTSPVLCGTCLPSLARVCVFWHIQPFGLSFGRLFACWPISQYVLVGEFGEFAHKCGFRRNSRINAFEMETLPRGQEFGPTRGVYAQFRPSQVQITRRWSRVW